MKAGIDFGEDVELVGVPKDVALDLIAMEEGIVGDAVASFVCPGVGDACHVALDLCRQVGVKGGNVGNLVFVLLYE